MIAPSRCRQTSHSLITTEYQRCARGRVNPLERAVSTQTIPEGMPCSKQAGSNAAITVNATTTRSDNAKHKRRLIAYAIAGSYLFLNFTSRKLKSRCRMGFNIGDHTQCQSVDIGVSTGTRKAFFAQNGHVPCKTRTSHQTRWRSCAATQV